jgi:DivIVA domain-containing protein
MTWFFAFVIVALMGVVAVVASGRGGSMAETYDDRPDSRVQADGPLTAADLRTVRFSTAFRGYRMSEVDSLLDRLAAEMTPLPEATAAQPDVPDAADRVVPAPAGTTVEQVPAATEEPVTDEPMADAAVTDAAVTGQPSPDEPLADEHRTVPQTDPAETEAAPVAPVQAPRHRDALQPDERRR